MTNKDVLSVVLARNAFYRRMHFLALGSLILVLVVILLLAGLLTYLLRNPVGPIYFAADRIGRLIKVVPVNVPNMSTDDAMKWTISAIEQSFSTDFINYRRQLQRSQRYFTTYGWSNYMAALNANNNLLAIRNRKMIAVAKVAAKPTLKTEGVLAGAYAWRFEVPVTMTYMMPPYDDKTRIINTLNMSVIIQRQEILKSDSGLGILQIVAQLVTTGIQPQEISRETSP